MNPCFLRRPVHAIHALGLLASLLSLGGCDEPTPVTVEPALLASLAENARGYESLAEARGVPNDFTHPLRISISDDTPGYRTAPSLLVEAVRQAEGFVHVGFKPSGEPALENRIQGSRGNRFATIHSINSTEITAGRAAILELGGEITVPFRDLPLVSAKIDPQLAPVLLAHPAIDYVEPVVRMSAGADQITPDNMIQIRAPLAWDHSTGGLNVYVVIIDSGIAGGVFNHNPDLEPLYGGWCLYSIEFTTCADDPGFDQYGHGTWVAGVSMASNNSQDVIGAAPEVHPQWTMIRVCGAPSFCSSNGIIEAVNWAANNGRKDVVNISLQGTQHSNATATAVAAAYAAGDLLVSIAGNTNFSGTLTYPGKYPEVIAVSGVTDQDTGHPGSVTGAEVEISAPHCVLTLQAVQGITGACGTSFAAPAVTGVAALAWAENPGWTNVELRSHLQATAKDLGSSGRDPVFGYGRIDAAAAVGMPLPSVSLSGPSTAPSAGQYTWIANASGGDGTYTYEWYRRTDYKWPRTGPYTCHYETSFVLVGTNQSYSTFVLADSELDFELMVKITSGSDTAADIQHVLVGDGTQPCPA